MPLTSSSCSPTVVTWAHSSSAHLVTTVNSSSMHQTTCLWLCLKVIGSDKKKNLLSHHYYCRLLILSLSASFEIYLITWCLLGVIGENINEVWCIAMIGPTRREWSTIISLHLSSLFLSLSLLITINHPHHHSVVMHFSSVVNTAAVYC